MFAQDVSIRILPFDFLIRTCFLWNGIWEFRACMSIKNSPKNVGWKTDMSHQCELCLLRIEVLHFYRGGGFTDFMKKEVKKSDRKFFKISEPAEVLTSLQSNTWLHY